MIFARLLEGFALLRLHSAPRRKIAGRGALSLALALVCLLSACFPMSETPPPPSPTTSPTFTVSPTITGTIVWFPPTATFTPFATREIQPTPDMHPGLGETLLQDDFSDTTQWQASRGITGVAAYGKGEFTLAVNVDHGMILSLRPKPVLADFYLEMDAYPTLCLKTDAYGLMLRAESRENYYRVWFNCSGEIRVERINNSRVTPLVDWTSSGQAAAGALVKARLGIWALGDEFRIFVNDVYQFSFRDPLYRSGQLGVLARAAGETPLTVSFSNLRVRAIDASRVPTPVPTPTQTVPPVPTRRPTATNSP